MNKFRITFQYKDGNDVVSHDIDIGLIQSISPVYNITLNKAGIASQPSQNAFAMDSGVKRNYSFSFRRVNLKDSSQFVDELNPNDPDASLKWSNGFWMYVMKKYVVNRWQTETDGCKIRYDVDSDVIDYYPAIPSTNVYVSEFRPEQDVGDVMTIGGTISFTVGATNIAKNIAKHTIVYSANFETLVPSSQDDTNYVTMTNNDGINAMKLPTSWRARAQEYQLTMGVFKWCTDPVPTQSSKVYDETGTGSFIDDLPETLNLYAIYDYHSP